MGLIQVCKAPGAISTLAQERLWEVGTSAEGMVVPAVAIGWSLFVTPGEVWYSEAMDGTILAVSTAQVWEISVSLGDVSTQMIVDKIEALRLPLDEYPILYLDEVSLAALDMYRFIDLYGGGDGQDE